MHVAVVIILSLAGSLILTASVVYCVKRMSIQDEPILDLDLNLDNNLSDNMLSYSAI
jgi:hypothetical protein